jgi:transcriptional regulator with XRE-family HTH domain
MTQGSGGGFERYLSERYPTREARDALDRKARGIAATARLIEALDEVRNRIGLSRTRLASRMNRKPAAISRLLNTPTPNPTIATLVEMLDAMNVWLDVEVRDQPADGKSHNSIEIRELAETNWSKLMLDRTGSGGEIMLLKDPSIFINVIGHGGSHGLGTPRQQHDKRSRTAPLSCLAI